MERKAFVCATIYGLPLAMKTDINPKWMETTIILIVLTNPETSVKLTK